MRTGVGTDPRRYRSPGEAGPTKRTRRAHASGRWEPAPVRGPPPVRGAPAGGRGAPTGARGTRPARWTRSPHRCAGARTGARGTRPARPHDAAPARWGAPGVPGRHGRYRTAPPGPGHRAPAGTPREASPAVHRGGAARAARAARAAHHHRVRVPSDPHLPRAGAPTAAAGRRRAVRRQTPGRRALRTRRPAARSSAADAAAGRRSPAAAAHRAPAPGCGPGRAPRARRNPRR